MQTIPIGLRGLDLLASAETGSGKTAAFLIPMIVRLMSLKDVATGPLGLILAPTRELAQQIFVEAQKLGVGTGLQFRCTIGGTNLDDQVELLQKAAYHVLIGTPGRVLDLLTQEFAVLHDCRWLVLDEADRMIDHGFTEQLMAILEFLPKRASDEGAVHQRQTAMYSATLPPHIISLARQYLHKPVRVAIGRIGKPVDRIQQRVVWIHDVKARNAALLRAISQQPSSEGLTIVFAKTKAVVDEVCTFLTSNGYRAVAIHSNKSQEQREASLQAFKEGRYDFLVSTDVTGRGIDIANVTHVIQYDIAASIEDYTHRIGRTGRAGNQGFATAFIFADDLHIMYQLNKLLKDFGVSVPKELADHPASQVPYDTYMKYATKEKQGSSER